MILWRFTESVVYINHLSIFINFTSCISLHECAIICSVFHQLMDIWIFLQFLLLQESCYVHLCTDFIRIFLLFLQDNYPGVWFLGNVVVIYLFLWKTTKMFSSVSVSFYILTSNVWVIQLFYIIARIGCCHYFYFRHPD